MTTEINNDRLPSNEYSILKVISAMDTEGNIRERWRVRR